MSSRCGRRRWYRSDEPERLSGNSARSARSACGSGTCSSAILKRMHRVPHRRHDRFVLSPVSRGLGGQLHGTDRAGIAARGHEVHLVAPWHPKWDRPKSEGGVHFHLFRYAPRGQPEHVRVRGGDAGRRPVARVGHRRGATRDAAGWFKALRVAQKKCATVVHAHWVIPGGVDRRGRGRLGSRSSSAFTARMCSSPSATRWRAIAARAAFRRARWVTACSEDLRSRAVVLGADHAASTRDPLRCRQRPVPARSAEARDVAARCSASPTTFRSSCRRTARQKKGIRVFDRCGCGADARSIPTLRVAIAGEGDLDTPLRARARGRRRRPAHPVPRCRLA